MPLTETTLKKAIDLLEVIKIGSYRMVNSKIVDIRTKEAFKNHDNWNVKTINDSIEKKDLSSAGLKSLIDSYFIYWNESVGLHIEKFWNDIEKKSLEFTRKDPLEYALRKNRFRNVHQGMNARKGWDKLKKSRLLKNRMTTEQILKLDEIIKQEELKRVQLVKKCLTKNKIPQTQYLKFGDSMEYLGYCGLFEKHFNQSEYQELNYIWQNFEAK